MGFLGWGKPGASSCILDKCVKWGSNCYSHVSDTLAGSVNHQGEKLSDNVCNENVTDVSHGVDCVPIHHISDETALSNSVIASNEQSGQQDIGQCVSDSDYPGLNPGPSICGHKGLSHSFHTNGHDCLNQVSHENRKTLNTNTLNENQGRVNTDCSDHCERSYVKPIYDNKYCGFEDKFTSILYANQKGSKGEWEVIDKSIHQLWHSQATFPCRSKFYQVLTFVQMIFLDLYSRYIILSRNLGSQIFYKLVFPSSPN